MTDQTTNSSKLVSVLVSATKHVLGDGPLGECRDHIVEDLGKQKDLSVKGYYDLLKRSTHGRGYNEKSAELILEHFCFDYLSGMGPTRFRLGVRDLFYGDHPKARRFNGHALARV